MNGAVSAVAPQTLNLLRSQIVLGNKYFGKIINFNVPQVCKLQSEKFWSALCDVHFFHSFVYLLYVLFDEWLAGRLTG